MVSSNLSIFHEAGIHITFYSSCLSPACAAVIGLFDTRCAHKWRAHEHRGGGSLCDPPGVGFDTRVRIANMKT